MNCGLERKWHQVDFKTDLVSQELPVEPKEEHEKLRKISGSHGGEYEDNCLLGYYTVKIDRRFRGAYCLHHHGSKHL
jgi:hypothetical protein